MFSHYCKHKCGCKIIKKKKINKKEEERKWLKEPKSQLAGAIQFFYDYTIYHNFYYNLLMWSTISGKQ